MDTWKNIQDQSNGFRMKPSEAAWRRVRQRLDGKKHRVVRLHAGAWAMAASILGLVIVTALLIYQRQHNAPTAFAPRQMETLNPADTDAVAGMALDFTRYLEQNHPDMMQGF